MERAGSAQPAEPTTFAGTPATVVLRGTGFLGRGNGRLRHLSLPKRCCMQRCPQEDSHPKRAVRPRLQRSAHRSSQRARRLRPRPLIRVGRRVSPRREPAVARSGCERSGSIRTRPPPARGGLAP